LPRPLTSCKEGKEGKEGKEAMVRVTREFEMNGKIMFSYVV
jgi:hypothetical protein